MTKKTGIILSNNIDKSRTIEVLPPPNKALAEAERIVPRKEFEELPFWKDLQVAEQSKLMSESYQLVTARREYGLALVSMGQHLLFIQNMLSSRPKAFNQYLKHFKFSGRSGYRYIEDYQRLLRLVKVPVLQVMLTKGFKLTKATRKRPLGELTEAYTALAMNDELPPTKMDIEAALRWWKKLITQHERLLADPRSLAIVKKKVEAEVGPSEKRGSYEVLLRDAYHGAKNAIKRVPAKRREEFVDTLVGFLLTFRDLQERHFIAQPIPGEMQRKPGRPPESTLSREPRAPRDDESQRVFEGGSDVVHFH